MSTQVCFVDNKGVPTKMLELGVAICGLGRRQPCPWELRAVSRTLIAFAGLRGQEVLVDPVGQATVSFEEAVDYQFPPDFSVCGATVCIGGFLADGMVVYGRIDLTRGRARYRPLRPRR